MKNIIIAILAIAVIALVASRFMSSESNNGPTLAVGTTNVVEKVVGGVKTVETNVVVEVTMNKDGQIVTEVEEAPLVRSVERRPLEPEATKRLHNGPVVVSSLFEASGRAEHASFGKAIKGSYLYLTTVEALSEVIEKNEDKGSGTIMVVEKRTFRQARDQLSVSDLDVAVALNTLPMQQIKQWANGLIWLTGKIGMALGYPAVDTGAKAVQAGVNVGFEALDAIDGKTARGVLGDYSVEVPPNIEEFVNKRVTEIANRKLEAVHVALQSIEGKSFTIKYSQASSGAPLNVDFANNNGQPITEAEWEILRTANAFLDQNVVPDSRCEVGDYWTVWADELQELFGTSGNGRAEGKIRVVREEDQPSGDWSLKIEPSKISVENGDGSAKGEIEVTDGAGIVDSGNASVKSLQATASGDAGALSRKRHMLFFDFVKKLDGEASMRFTLASTPADDPDGRTRGLHHE